MRDSGQAPRESIYAELLTALASRRERKPASAPELAAALGTSPQLVVARLQPLVRAGLISRRSETAGQVYTISEEGRDYLRVAGGPSAGAAGP